MAITTRDGLVSALAAGQELDYLKSSQTATVGRYSSLFRTAGRPGAAATPGTTGNACTSATQGAIPFNNPTTGLTYLGQMGVSSTQVCGVILYDRLVETAGLSGVVTTAQTVNSATLPTRAAGGAGVGLWIEVYSALGASASGTVTVSYTNSSGVSGRTGTVIGGFPASLVANTMLPVALQAGDMGVQSVQSVTSTTSTGTAGSFGVTLTQRICEIGAMANTSTVLSWADLGLPIVKNDACLSLIVLPSATTTSVLIGSFILPQG